MRKALRGYAKDKNANLVLMGTMPVPFSKDKCPPAFRREKRHLVRRGATILRKRRFVSSLLNRPNPFPEKPRHMFFTVAESRSPRLLILVSSKPLNQMQSIETRADYDRVLAELDEHFFDGLEPEPGTPEAERYQRLCKWITDYEDKHYPIEDLSCSCPACLDGQALSAS
jgi:hypothetical protein